MNRNNSFSCLPDKKGRYIVLDTETTGVDINKDFLISLSAVEIVDGKISKTKNGRNMMKGVCKICGTKENVFLKKT